MLHALKAMKHELFISFGTGYQALPFLFNFPANNDCLPDYKHAFVFKNKNILKVAYLSASTYSVIINFSTTFICFNSPIQYIYI
jgi:hypothetical protein